MEMDKFNLKKSLQKIGLSQKDFAKLCGVSPVTVNRWCNGWVPTPKYAELVFTYECRDRCN